MPHGSHGFHYVHKRKKSLVKEKVSKSQSKLRKVMDRLVYMAGIIGPVMTMPQVIKVWSEKNASGIAVETWGAYLFLSLIWLSYGILHKEKPLIIMYSAYFLINVMIVSGVLMYS